MGRGASVYKRQSDPMIGYMQRDAGGMNYLWLRLVNNCEKM